MSTQYIVKFVKNADSKEQDCYVELNNNITPSLTVRTHKDENHELNVNLLYKVITNNFAEILFNDETRECSLTYKDSYIKNKVYISVIKFDANSSSAYTEFKNELTVLINSKYETEYYPNGKIMYVGEVLYVQDTNVQRRIPNGKGTVYYNCINNCMKYAGEFESGMYDGSGKFYSMDGKICLTVNNISAGIPISVGRLNMKFNKCQDDFEINFIELWDKLGLHDKIAKRKYVASDTFINDLANMYWANNYIKLDELIFSDQSIDDKYTEIWKEIKTLQKQFNEQQQYNKQQQEYNKQLKNTIIVTTGIIVFSQVVLHLLC